MDGITEERHVVSSGKPRVLSKCAANIPATGAATFTAFTGASYGSLSLLNWPRNFVIIAIIAFLTVFSKSCR
jgi:hypothetical protein